jgi:hypothetical protein
MGGVVLKLDEAGRWWCDFLAAPSITAVYPREKCRKLRHLTILLQHPRIFGYVTLLRENACVLAQERQISMDGAKYAKTSLNQCQLSTMCRRIIITSILCLFSLFC